MSDSGIHVCDPAFGFNLALSYLGITADEIPWAKRVLSAARAYRAAPGAVLRLADDLLSASNDRGTNE
jgi:hypothetical protein